MVFAYTAEAFTDFVSTLFDILASECRGFLLTAEYSIFILPAVRWLQQRVKFHFPYFNRDEAFITIFAKAGSVKIAIDRRV